jgi:HEAT repeat protein
VEPKFREGLREALRVARKEGSQTRQEWILVALGLMQDGEALGLFEDVLYPADDAPRSDAIVRLRAMQGLFHLESPAALPLLARTANDDDAEVRALTHLVLARMVDGDRPHGGALAGDPRVEDLLEPGLADADAGVRVNAAVALALAGNPAGAGLVARALDRAELAALGFEDPAVQRAALLNAIRAARRLGGDELRTKVERLTQSEHEGEDWVRQWARRALERWSTT